MTEERLEELNKFMEHMWEYFRKRASIRYVCFQSKENGHLEYEEQVKMFDTEIEKLDKEYLAPFELEFKVGKSYGGELYHKGVLIRGVIDDFKVPKEKIK